MIKFCVGLILLCIVLSLLLPALVLVFAACILGTVVKLVLDIIGIGFRITFKSIFAVCLLVMLLSWIF